MEDNELYVVTLTDDEGVDRDFELIGEAELDGNKYYALTPYSEDANDEDELEYVILKEIEENSETMLITIDDDDEFAKVADEFDRLFSEEMD